MKIYRFRMDCGRMGSLDGVFTAEVERIEAVMGTEVYLGEVLGKHSEVFVTLSDENIVEVECSPEFVEEFRKVVGGVGINPLDYIEE